MKVIYIIKEEIPNKKKDLCEIILTKNEQATKTVILTNVLNLYPELIDAKLELEWKNDIIWKLKPALTKQKYIGSVNLYVTHFRKEEIPQFHN